MLGLLLAIGTGVGVTALIAPDHEPGGEQAALASFRPNPFRDDPCDRQEERDRKTARELEASLSRPLLVPDHPLAHAESLECSYAASKRSAFMRFSSGIEMGLLENEVKDSASWTRQMAQRSAADELSSVRGVPAWVATDETRVTVTWIVGDAYLAIGSDRHSADVLRAVAETVRPYKAS